MSEKKQLESKLRLEKSNFSILWSDKIKDQTGVSYYHFMNMLNGRSPIRDDVKIIIAEYLGEDQQQKTDQF